MTDDQRFRLDAQLRERLVTARADLSRLRQLAQERGEVLQGLGSTLARLPENVNLWKRDDG